MKTLIISPRSSSGGLESLRSGNQILQGALYVAASARNAGHESMVVFADESDILSQMEQYQPEVLGVSCVTSTYPIARRMISLVKDKYPKIYTILGGHHATFMTKEIFAECPVDYICRGEGEEAFPALLNALAMGERYPDITGIAYVKDGQVFNDDRIALLDNLDSVPQLTPDLVPPGVTFFPKIISSRGCPYKCEFCSITSFFNGQYHRRKVEDVIKDIKVWVGYGHRMFWFHDDNFTLDTTWVRDYCKALKDNGLKITWNCNSRVDTICRDPELVKIMSDAGCGMMALGIESGIQEVLDRMKKNITIEQVLTAIKILDKTSIFHSWYMILGSGDEFDTPAYLQQNIDFFKKIPFNMLLISIMTPFPGTPLYERIDGQGRLLHKNWELYDAAHCVYQPYGISPKEMEAFLPKAYKQLYWARGLRNITIGIKGLRRGAIRWPMLTNGFKVLFKTYVLKKSFHSVLRKDKGKQV